MDATATSTYNPTYLIGQSPNKYGENKQEDYLLRANQAMAKATEHLNAAILNKRDLKAVFFELLDLFGKERKAIAVAHGSSSAEDFGLRRDLECVGGISTTPLANEYSQYNHKLLLWLHGVLKTMKHNNKIFFESKKTINETCLGRKSLVEIELITHEQMEEKLWLSPPTQSDLPDYAKHFTASNTIFTEQENEAIRKLKKEFPKLYERQIMWLSLTSANVNFPSRKITKINDVDQGEIFLANLKSVYVCINIRLEINKTMYLMSRCLTWLYQDFQTDPVDRMLQFTPPIIITHQDPLQAVPDTLAEIAAIFERIVLWDKKNPVEFNQNMALFRYTFAHCMPFARGSAAIAEWFEQIMCAHRGSKAPSGEKKMYDLEALTSPLLSQFVQAYSGEIKNE